MSALSCIYAGAVLHRRIRPRQHVLKHSCFWLYLNLDELEELHRRRKLFSLNRFNLMSLHMRDFGDGSGTPLREQALRHLAVAGIDLSGGRIMLMAMPRILGYGFNPLSIWYCHHSSGALRAVIYEVHNTFGERHSYLIPVDDDARVHRHGCGKSFYVSPFMDMDLHYDFTLAAPDETMSVAIRTSDRQGAMLNAVMSGKRLDFTDGALARLLATHPLASMKVMAAIHVHAAILWWKGLKLRARTPAPFFTLEIVRPPVS